MAVLHKKKATGRLGQCSSITDTSSAEVDPTAEQQEPVRKRVRKDQFDPSKPAIYEFVTWETEEVRLIRDYFGLDPAKFPIEQLMARTESVKRQTLFVVSRSLSLCLRANQDRHLKLIHAGVRIFARNEARGEPTCPYRLSQEGLPVAYPHLSRKRIVEVPMSDLLQLLREENPLFDSFTPATTEYCRSADNGSCVVDYVGPTGNGGIASATSKISLCSWRGRGSLALLISKQERASLLARLQLGGLLSAD